MTVIKLRLLVLGRVTVTTVKSGKARDRRARGHAARANGQVTVL